MKIDSHHHFWHYAPQEYEWIDDRMVPLRRDFLPEDLEPELRLADVQATIAVQACQSLAETQWLLDLASGNAFIQGVVGWAPIADTEFPRLLDELRQNPLLKGLRHVVQAEAAGFLEGEAFNRGIAAMRGTGLVYDLLIYARQLHEAARFVDRHPNQVFVLDHIAKPDIAGGQFAPWSASLRALALRENVVCKVSGMVTEADWNHWTADSLRPYFETVLDAFGPSRLMFGSDWPVLTLACTYQQWSQTVAHWLAPLSAAERAEIEGGVAARTYGLGSHPPLTMAK